ncbi:MAG: DUF1595 domain-containing protein, partial [Gemmatimonadetes bacterium]|nr:DUF1595 domain-containing protein [Gemmatimonadota bacterium]
MASDDGRLAPCDDAAPACLEELVRGLGRRAYRRPLAPDEVDRLVALGTGANEALGNADETVALVIAAMLQSPHFL